MNAEDYLALASPVEPLSFDEMMIRAQRLHSAGQVELAAMAYGLATTQAPNDSEFGRALRGQAVGLYRQGGEYFDKAFQLAQGALNVHGSLVELAPHDAERRSMRLESARVVARMALSQTLRQERRTQRIDGAAFTRVGGILTTALEDLTKVAADSQHAKNFYPLGAIALALLPDRTSAEVVQAHNLAHHARRLAISAESPSGSTSAQLGRRHQLRAAGMASYRAAAASAVVRLATPEPSARRRSAVRVASLPMVL